MALRGVRGHDAPAPTERHLDITDADGALPPVVGLVTSRGQDGCQGILQSLREDDGGVVGGAGGEVSVGGGLGSEPALVERSL